MSLRRMMIFTLGAKIKSLIQAFKERVLSSQGEFEAETCLDVQLTDLDNKGLLDSASLIVTPNAYKENLLFAVKPDRVGTNLLLYSQDWTQSVWQKGGATVVSSTRVAPDGTSTGTELSDVGASGTPNAMFQNNIIATSPNIVYSIYTKAVSLTTNGRRAFLLRNGTTSTNFDNLAFDYSSTGNLGNGWFSENVGNGWFRLSYTRTTGISVGDILVIYYGRTGAAAVGATDVWQVWGAQVDTGTTLNEYIPTTSVRIVNGTIGDLSFTRPSIATRFNQDGLLEPSPYNLFSWSEDFSNSLWSKNNLTITTNQTIAPDGNYTADLYVPNTVNGEHQFNQAMTSTTAVVFVVPTNTYNLSIYVKPAGNNFFLLRANINGAWSQNTYNLSTGTVVASPNFISANIEDVGNGWFLLSCVFTSLTAANAMQFVSTPNGSAGFTGDGVSGAYVWGAQLTLGAVRKDYFPTTTRFNVPRLDYGSGTCPTMLVEPQMTNSWTNNNNTAGYTSNTNAVKGATVSNAFGEGFYGFEYNFIGGGLTFISSVNTIRVFDTRTFPVQRLCLYVKAPSSDFFGINYTNVGQVIYRFSTLEVSDSTIGAIKNINEDTYALYIHNDAAVTGQFSQVRVAFVTSLTNDDNVDGSAILGMAHYQGGATGSVQIQNYNYIPVVTGSSAVTRNADVFSSANGINLIGQTEGTIFLDFDRTSIFAGIKALLTLFSVTNDETFYIQTANNGYTTIVVSIISVANGVSVARSMTLLEGRNKLAVVYSTSGTKIFLNGTQLTPLANTALPVMNTINLSNRTGQRIYGPIRQFSLWKTQITDTQAIELTTL